MIAFIMNHNSGMKKIMGMNHDLKLVTIFLDDNGGQHWLGKTKSKQPFR